MLNNSLGFTLQNKVEAATGTKKSQRNGCRAASDNEGAVKNSAGHGFDVVVWCAMGWALGCSVGS